MEGFPLGPGGEDITWPDQVAPRGRKASSTRKIKPQTSNLFTLYFHARNYKIDENVGQVLLYRTLEHAAAAGFQVPSESPTFAASKHCACNNDNKDENGIVDVAPNEVVEHIEFHLESENAENNEGVELMNGEDDIEGTMQELNPWLQEAKSLEDINA